MTNNIDRNRINLVCAAMNFLKSLGIPNPTADEVSAIIEKWQDDKKNQAEQKKKLKKTKEAKKDKEWNESPDLVKVTFEDGSEIICETQTKINKRTVDEFAKEIKKLCNGRPIKKVDLITRYKIGKVLIQARIDRLGNRLAKILGVSVGWCDQTVLLTKCISFEENLKEIIAFAEENKFVLTWSHVLAATSTRDNDRCCNWLKIAAYNHYSAKDLARKIANRAEDVVQGKTEQDRCIEEVQEITDAKKCLETKVKDAILGEPLRGNMSHEEFLAKFCSVVDVSTFFNIRTIR